MLALDPQEVCHACSILQQYKFYSTIFNYINIYITATGISYFNGVADIVYDSSVETYYNLNFPPGAINYK